MCTAGEAVCAFGHGAEYAEADGADKARVYDAAVAEAGGSEVDGVVGRGHEGGAGAVVGHGVGEEEVRE